MRTSWFLSRITLALLAMFVMVAAGCGPDAGPSEETKLGTDDMRYGIKVLIDNGKEEKLYTFAPVVESLPQAAPGTKPLGLEGVDDPTANPWSTAWALVWRAALECQKADAVIPPGALTGSTDRSSFHIVGNPASCVQSIKEQERLLCVADKMAEIADAVGPVVWPARNSTGAEVVVGESDIGASSGQGSSGPLGGKWTIPPQSDKDRFIVRDLAIHIVGQIPYLASVPLGALRGRPSNAQEARGCTQLFTDIGTSGTSITTGTALNQAFQAAFGIQLTLPTLEYKIPALPFDKPMLVYENPSGTKVLKTDNSPLFARFALTMQTQVLRGAGNLLHDLVRRSVYSDLSGAEQRRAAAMDTVRGGRIAWGDEGPFNSYAHAVRVLAGRWEMTPAQPDPACGGIKALDLLAKAYGDERSARTDDRPITTQGQATAARLVEQAGIALPECALATTDAAALRSMLKTQLQLQTETAHNLPPDPNGIVAPGALDHGTAIRRWHVLAAEVDDGVAVAERRAAASTGRREHRSNTKSRRDLRSRAPAARYLLRRNRAVRNLLGTSANSCSCRGVRGHG